MTITYHDKVWQGTDEWFDLRRGILTASEMRLCVTPTLKIADNEKTRAHLYELLAQRISGFTEPTYQTDDMVRGQEDEIYAREYYHKNYEPVREMGFVTNDKWGFTLGYSPDGLVGDDGLIEVKSRRQKYQVETIIANEMPCEYNVQIQTALLVTERSWCDFISFCGGLPMFTKRFCADEKIQACIIEAATRFHETMDAKLRAYADAVTDPACRLLETKRIIREEIFV